MDSSSNSLCKILPKAIAAERQRNKAPSTAETASSKVDVPQRAERGSRSNPGSDASSLNGSLTSIGKTDETIPTSRSSQSQDSNGIIPSIRFTNIEDLFNFINDVSGDILKVTDVSSEDLKQIDRERIKRSRKFRFRLYSVDTRVLLISLTTSPHEILHCQLDWYFRRQLISRV
ncbi:hypothetical protein VTI74DRAFT_7105 [Chaetomium olivicolor]